MSTQLAEVPLVDLLTDVAVDLGATVVEVRRDLGLRRQMARAVGLDSVPAATWHQVQDRLLHVTVRAAGDRARCKRCSSPVRWVRTSAKGKAMPIDPLPHPMGNVVLEVDGAGRHTARVFGNDKLPLSVEAFRSHHATCPTLPRPPAAASAGPVRVSSCRVAGCGWEKTSPDRLELERAWSSHWMTAHHDRCLDCGAGPLRWARRVDTGEVLALDPVSPAGGPWALRSIGSGSWLAAPAPSLVEGFAVHDCPGGGS